MDTIEGEELDSIEAAAHEILASQDGWRWVVSRGCKVAVLRGADSYAKMEQEFMSRLYPRRSTFYRLGADWRRVELRGPQGVPAVGE